MSPEPRTPVKILSGSKDLSLFDLEYFVLSALHCLDKRMRMRRRERRVFLLITSVNVVVPNIGYDGGN